MKKKAVVPPVLAVLITVMVFLMGTFTPLLSVLNPATGVVQNARNLVIGNETFSLPRLSGKVTVVQDAYGVYHFYAPDVQSLYFALGFVQAKERLEQIEVFGLEGMGQMARFFGSSYQNYDRFQTLTGAPITAEKDWKSVVDNASVNSTDMLTREALTEYAAGINAYINLSEADHLTPVLFKLLGVEPYYWTPVYSYAVQEIMTQQLEFGTEGLKMTIIHNLLGNYTYDLFPTFSPVQKYYYGGYGGAQNGRILGISHNTYPVNSTVISLANSLLRQFSNDPPIYFPLPVSDHSNEIVVAGNRTATGYPILMGGPVLGFSLPAIWFQVQLVAPGLDVYGVVLPGAPAVIIGFNRNIAWTLTDTQAIADGTFFFVQHIAGSDYEWNGTLYPVTEYRINGFEVNWTNLGPVMVRSGSTAIVMDWMGNMVSNEIGALLEINYASNWTGFRSDLSIWKAPYQNFAFASRTVIADISPAFYPVFSGDTYNPAAIMPGNGSEYISGSIPYSMVPQVVNPPQGFIVSSNQRQVGPAYPYWFGMTNSFSDGYRAQMEVNFLEEHPVVSLSGIIGFQSTNYTDYEAQAAVPHILAYISGSTNPMAEKAYSLLSGWNYNMTTNSLAASVWFFTYEDLFNNTFLPFLGAHGWFAYNSTLGIPSGMGGSLPGTTGSASMEDVLLSLILDGTAAPFSNRSMASLVTSSVIEAMQYLESSYPAGNYTWGHFYGFLFPNLFGLSEFNVGPIPKGGDFNTPNDASGVGPDNYPTGGQSWEMAVNMGNVSGSYGIYPGGQSENPASQQYSSYIKDWIDGTYLPLIFYPSASSIPKNQVLSVITLDPAGGG
ncbi:MAG: penicillin acylase family protein [Thermoplasmata archaeon]|uniref:Penicillin acylase family protein n=1 Tax=Candidatus Sysuiplasma superficiale TaxID=2823368 RepID=A0A8J8CDD3_9ARCH|nr:penicillin acylase family protein [Candidatus Sysuiplasma superficiale]